MKKPWVSRVSQKPKRFRSHWTREMNEEIKSRIKAYRKAVVTGKSEFLDEVKNRRKFLRGW